MSENPNEKHIYDLRGKIIVISDERAVAVDALVRQRDELQAKFDNLKRYVDKHQKKEGTFDRIMTMLSEAKTQRDDLLEAAKEIVNVITYRSGILSAEMRRLKAAIASCNASDSEVK